MNDMSTKAGRIAYGKEAEDLLMGYFIANTNFKVKSSAEDDSWSPTFDLINGDIFIQKFSNSVVTKIDVKRVSNKTGKVFISYKSATKFEGDFFAFVNINDVAGTIFFQTKTIRNYIERVKESGNLIKAQSGDEGYYFEPWKMKFFYNMENFIEL